LRVFAERGFHRATIKEIAREAGIKSPALIYWYFEDKDDLFRAALMESSPLARLAADPASLMDRPPEEVLPMLARAHLDSFDDPAVVRLLRLSLSESALNPGTSSGFIQGLQKMVLGFFVAYLERQNRPSRSTTHNAAGRPVHVADFGLSRSRGCVDHDRLLSCRVLRVIEHG
jgi:TetR/AcrR family transcriptional regulator